MGEDFIKKPIYPIIGIGREQKTFEGLFGSFYLRESKSH